MSVSEILGYIANHTSTDCGCTHVLHKTLPHIFSTVAIVHVTKVMAIARLCESAQQFRAWMMILQYHKSLSMISIFLSQCLISCVSVWVLSPVLYRQSLYIPFQFRGFFNYLYIEKSCQMYG